MSKCPHCGANLSQYRLAGEDSAGIDFLVVYWMHRGFSRKSIANALGRSVASIQKREKRAWQTFGVDCDFYLTKRLKSGETRLDGFFRSGQYFRIALATNEIPVENLSSKTCVYYPVGEPDAFPPYQRRALPWDRGVVELDDWVRLGFRLSEGVGVYADSE